MSKGEASPDLEIWIENERISPEWIKDWERRSARRALRKLGIKPEHHDLARLSRQVGERKQALGHQRLLRLLARDLLISEAVAKVASRLSGGRRRLCVTEIYCPTGSAELFARWFEEVENLNREEVMVAAVPEHWVIQTHQRGRQELQEVIETTGGSPLPSRFFVNYADQTGLQSRRDPSYPVQVAGAARTADGSIIGGVRHQFRDEGTGFRAKLTVEFPLLSLPWMISGHRWHLACEFSNWISMALREEPDNAPDDQ